MFNSASSRLVIFAITMFFAIAFACNFININFRVANSNLEKDIEQLEDEKALLRANYLSEISMDKLNSKADLMQMKHADHGASYKASKKIESQRLARLMPNTQKTFQKKILLVSGY